MVELMKSFSESIEMKLKNIMKENSKGDVRSETGGPASVSSPATSVDDHVPSSTTDLAKPTPLRADYAVAPDFSTAIRSSSSRLPELVFVVNLKGANGRTGEDWKRLLPYVRSRLGDCISGWPSECEECGWPF
ncbi:hypothetical protein QQ045_017846 [Rhodiola kirilowii]